MSVIVDGFVRRMAQADISESQLRMRINHILICTYVFCVRGRSSKNLSFFSD